MVRPQNTLTSRNVVEAAAKGGSATETRLAGGSNPDGFLIDFLTEVSLNQSVQELRAFASF